MANAKGKAKEEARFCMTKQRHSRTMLEAIEDGKADPQMVPLLRFIASSKEFFTSSSCAGRILLLKLDSKGSKAESAFIQRWHRQVKFSELWSGLQNCGAKKEIWFKLDPFILHVGTNSLVNARRLLKVMQNAGIKRGGIVCAKEGKFLVELLGTQSVALPLKSRGRMLVQKQYLKWLLGKANKKLGLNYAHLKRLESAFRKEL